MLIAPLAELERALIETFIQARGLDPAALARLPEADRVALLTEASVAVSAKLAEIEARSHYLHDLHE
jgi:hypothetical protein